jgi:hypothetical protein
MLKQNSLAFFIKLVNIRRILSTVGSVECASEICPYARVVYMKIFDDEVDPSNARIIIIMV